jgi:hypothetical protein
MLSFEGGRGIVRTFGFKLGVKFVLIGCTIQVIGASSAMTHIATSHNVQHVNQRASCIATFDNVYLLMHAALHQQPLRDML